MSIYLLPLLLVTLFSQANCVYGVDVSQLYGADVYTCMKNAGITFANTRGYHSYGGLDQNAVKSLSNIKAAGLKADVYMFPCRGKEAAAQVTELVNGISASLYDTIWLDIETNTSPGCSWSGHDAASNCQFVMDLIGDLHAKSKKVGIYASRYMWGSIFGSYTACAQAATNIPLWYAHYDNTPSFADFQAFGGWKTPSIKQYLGTSTICNASVDRNWHP
jgi:GH25 family lysozyme M1 (1,4-beta-N-acetylmuramidase)